MRQVVFDLETTGFTFATGDRIVEIGAVELVNGALTGKTFHTYIDPERDMPEGAYKVHGLSAEFLKGKPKFADPVAGPAFAEFVKGSQLVAHNGISFDLPFIQAELEAAKLPRLENPILDTLHLARRKFPGAPASLDALCARFGVDTKERERDGHGALLDSRLLAEVYIELTGGAQAGLDFARENDVAADNGVGARRVIPQRPTPLASRITEKERDAHAAFVAELGDDCLWTKLSASDDTTTPKS